MSRNLPDALKGGTGTVYRVTIEHRMADDSSTYWTEHLGPYATEGAAKGRFTEALGRAKRGGRKARGRIESMTGDWKAVTAA